MSKLLIATHNPGKIREFREMLAPRSIEVVSAADYNLPEPVEDGATFYANALLKARAACEATGLPALSDDSGLCVAALNGAPGIYSARWAGEHKDFTAAMARIQHELGDTDNRRACFMCVLALAKPDGTHEFFEGRVEGDLVWPPRGLDGFGYDPMFQPDGFDITFGEMDKTAKNAISHRALALAEFLKSL